MSLNKLNVKTTRRLSIGLIASSGGFLFASFNLLSSGMSIGDNSFVRNILGAVHIFIISGFFGFLSLAFTELAEHPDVPVKGHPHSKMNYLESAFVYLTILGLGSLIWGIIRVIRSFEIYLLAH